MNATAVLLCFRIVIGEDGGPQGVVGLRIAMGVKPSSFCRPVPPMTAIGTGPVDLSEMVY